MEISILWDYIKFALTIFTLILIPVYWRQYGVHNFLWLSDIGLFLTVIALWIHSPLLMSMAAVGVLFVELFWNAGFFSQIIFKKKITHLTDYMFDAKYPRMLRALSLFHCITPMIWFLYLAQYGYDTRAFFYFTLLYWIILFLTYTFTNPAENINWVFMPRRYGIKIAPSSWLVFLFIGFPLLIFLPTHYLYIVLFQKI